MELDIYYATVRSTPIRNNLLYVDRQRNFIAKFNGGEEVNIFGNVISLLVHEFPCRLVNYWLGNDRTAIVRIVTTHLTFRHRASSV